MYRLLILYTLLERYPYLKLVLDESESNEKKLRIIPMCKISKLVCRDPELTRDELDFLPTSGKPDGTYHLTHFHSYMSESCNSCQVYTGAKIEHK